MPNSDNSRIRMLRFLAKYISGQRDNSGRREIGNKGLSDALRQEFEHTVDPSTVSRMIKELWSTGTLVEWADLNSLHRGTVKRGASEQLRDDFNLREALVVHGGSTEPDANETKLHYLLANEAADEVRSKQLFRRVHHLGVGPGRTMVRYAESIMNRPPEAAQITISPMAGRLWVGNIWRFQEELPDSSNIEAPLDADFAALFIARGLHQAGKVGVRLSQISHLAYVESKQQAEHIAELRCPFLMNGQWNHGWDLKAPDRIVFGAASLAAEEHRIPKLLNRTVEKSGSKSVIQKVVDSFRKSHALVHTRNLPPLADLCVGIFPTLPLPNERGTFSFNPRDYEALAKLLRELNSLTLSVKWAHLQRTIQAGSVSQLIAGGASKHRVLWTLLLPSAVLDSDQRLINSICTDEGTAEVLRRSLKEMNRDTALLKQYRELLASVFAASQ